MPLVSKAFGDIITFTRASTGSYFDSAGVLQSAAINAPRLDYDPTTLAAQGLLIEEQRVNSIRNNTMVGAVAGTPGTLPTNWGSVTNGLTQEIVGTGTVNGITYIDVKFSGTTTGANTSITLEGIGIVTASTGQNWNVSSWISVIAGSTANITAARLIVDERSTVYLTSQNGPDIRTSLSSVLQRFNFTSTLANVATTNIQPLFRLTSAASAVIDITLRIGLPQLELGAFATSVIPTTTVAVTRSADVASVNTLSPWFNATSGTLFAEFSSYASESKAIVGISDETLNNRIQFFANTGDPYTIASRLVSGGTQTNPANTGSIAVGAVGKAALAYAVGTNQGAISVNGGAPTTSSPAATAVGVNTLELGKGSALAAMSGYLRRITYYPRRLSNAELQAITA